LTIQFIPARWLFLLVATFVAIGPLGQIASAAAGTVTEFPLPSTFLFPSSITTGPDGALWFTETSIGMIGRVTTAGVFTEFVLPNNPGPNPGTRPIPERPQVITSGPDGALWYTVRVFSQTCLCVLGGKIGRITTGGSITEFTLPTGNTRRTAPNTAGITTGPDGNLWFTDSNLAKVGRITTSGSLTQFAVTGSPVGIVAGPDGALWLTANAGTSALLGRITVGGVASSFTVATGVDGVTVGTALAAGPDGNLWLSDYDSLRSAGAILRVTTAGSVTAFPFATFDEIDGITTGPDGAMWFTLSQNQTGASDIGRITTT
jgi:virginiamycin B lyase